ncbi:MAG: DNA polymerase III subunit delta [Pseudomonadota bacterium]
MKIDSEQLAPHLARDLKPLYTVFGDEPLLALEAQDRIRQKARAKGHDEREVLVIESGFDWGRLMASGASLSLFSSKRLLELRIPNGKPGVEGAKALEAFCAVLPADTVTLIALPETDWKAQKAGWFETLEQSGVLVEAKPVERARLPQWIAGRLAQQGQEASRETLEFISDRVEGNLLAAFQEVQKLALLFPQGRLEFGAVKDAVLDVARYDVYKLGEILLAGDALHLVRVLEGLEGEGVAPPLVLWAMSEEIRALARIKGEVEAGQPQARAMRAARVWGARQAQVQSALPRFSRRQLENALRHAARLDRMIKGLGKGDVWDELLQLGLRLCPLPKAAHAVSR